MDTTMSANVLFVDTEAPIRELAERTIGESHAHLRLTTLASPDEALTHLDSESVDCVVTDYSMPGTDGLEFRKDIRERDPRLPVVFFTRRGSEDLASEAITTGVTEYIRKEPGAHVFERLGSRTDALVRVRQAETAAREADRRVAVTASHDDEGVSVFVQNLTPLKERDEEMRELAEELEDIETQFRTLTTKLSRPVPPSR